MEQEEDEYIDKEANDSHLDATSTQWRGSSNGSWRGWWHGTGWGSDGRIPLDHGARWASHAAGTAILLGRMKYWKLVHVTNVIK